MRRKPKQRQVLSGPQPGAGSNLLGVKWRFIHETPANTTNDPDVGLTKQGKAYLESQRQAERARMMLETPADGQSFIQMSNRPETDSALSWPDGLSTRGVSREADSLDALSKEVSRLNTAGSLTSTLSEEENARISTGKSSAVPSFHATGVEDMLSQYARVVAANDYENYSGVGRSIRDSRFASMATQKSYIPAFDEIYRNYGVEAAENHDSRISANLDRRVSSSTGRIVPVPEDEVGGAIVAQASEESMQDTLDQEVEKVIHEGAENQAEVPTQNDRSRSPSPVIIWKPSARVKLATDLPPELKSVFLHDYCEGNDTTSPKVRAVAPGGITNSGAAVTHNQGGSQSANTSPNARSSPKKKKVEPKRTYIGLERSLDSTFNYQAKEPKPKQTYGAWYLPPVRWRRKTGKVSRNGDDGNNVTSLDFSSMKYTVAAKGKPNPGMIAKINEMKNEIPHLHIAQAYKSFLNKNAGKLWSHEKLQKEGGYSARRQPHYLQHVSELKEKDPEIAKKRSSSMFKTTAT